MALIVEAVQRGDPDEAAAACMAHVATAAEIASSYLTERQGKEEVFPFRGKGRRRNSVAKDGVKAPSSHLDGSAMIRLPGRRISRGLTPVKRLISLERW